MTSSVLQPARCGAQPRGLHRPKLGRLMRELLHAHQSARQPEVASVLAECDLKLDSGIIFGVDHVEVDANHYAPAPNGKSALIIPYFHDGALFDLVACGLETRTCRNREGICTVLGQEWLDHARDHGTRVRIFRDPIEWLRNDRRGASVIDWRAAHYVLADLDGIVCTSELLAAKVERALQRPSKAPQIFVQQVAHAA
jgi:hypothetical protein